jgi:HEPN domain-containing protein
MANDPARVADARAWLVKARQDLRGVRLVLAAEPPLLDDAVFHCQQAAEKSFKAFLTWHDVPFRRTHSLEEVGEQCIAIDASLRTLVDHASPLTEYAWKFRYPGEPAEPSLAEATQAMQVADQVYAEIVARLPTEVDPVRDNDVK